MKTSTLVRNGVSTETVELILRLIKLIPWPERRSAMGDVVLSLLDGKPRVAQTVFGWNRHTVEVGIHEFQTGIVCINDITTRVKPRAENKDPKLLADIQAIMEPHSESDLSLRTTLLYSNMTAKMVHGALIQKGWSAESLPKVRTISNILNRQNYRLRTVAKTKVQKKTAETDAIFENVRRVNEQADADPQTLRISIDTKATVHVGEYSRSGRSRGVVAVKAKDHDMGVKEKLVPGGILEPVSGKPFLFFGTNTHGHSLNGGGFFSGFGGLLLALQLSRVGAFCSQVTQAAGFSLSLSLVNRAIGPLTQSTGEQFALNAGFKLPRLAPGLGHAKPQTFIASITHQDERRTIRAGGAVKQAMRKVVGSGVVHRGGLAWACHFEPHGDAQPDLSVAPGLMSRLGAKAVVAATLRAVQLLGRQFVLGQTLPEAQSGGSQHPPDHRRRRAPAGRHGHGAGGVPRTAPSLR
ncbi:MAG: hypothetical protein IPH35_15680 [Rhodoferax sp.]|nr:hypothetical protein [Rhodoferax sp.]